MQDVSQCYLSPLCYDFISPHFTFCMVGYWQVLFDFFNIVYCVRVVVGKKTGETLEKHGFKADFIPSEFVAENFVKEFIPLLEENTKVLLPKGNRARSIIAKAIKSAGAHCEELILYETYFPKESGPVVVDLLKNHSLDVITFTSSSTVEHFMEIVRTHQLQPYLDNIIITVIGPIAEKTALNYGLKVEVCPEQYTVSAMIDSLAAYLIMRRNK